MAAAVSAGSGGLIDLGLQGWYGMGRSGVLPTALGKVNPKRKTPVNAIHLEVAVHIVAFACVLIWGVTDVFFTWANAITIGLILMYILANIGPVNWGLLVFIAVLALTILALIYLRVRGQEDWMRKAQLVFEQSGSGH